MTYLEWQKVRQGVKYTELRNVRILSWKTEDWQHLVGIRDTLQYTSGKWGTKKTLLATQHNERRDVVSSETK